MTEENKTEIVTVDIETTPTGKAAELFEHQPPGNWKDPEKIEAHRVEALGKWLEKAALSPMLGRVVAIGYLQTDPKTGKLTPFIDLAKHPAYEERLITRFFETLLGGNKVGIQTTVRGYNFHDFDLIFLLTRARLLQLPILDKLLPNFRDLKHYVDDVYKEATCWCGYSTKDALFPSPTGRLEEMAKAFGCRSNFRDNQCEGKEFGEYIMSEEPAVYQKALNHLEADLWECYELSQMLRMRS